MVRILYNLFMFKLTMYHTPSYFQFYICSPEASSEFLLNNETQKYIEKNKFANSTDFISVSVNSEYSEIPIKVEFDNEFIEIEDPREWDNIVECTINARIGKIQFLGCGDNFPFGELNVKNGLYRVRINYGNQNYVSESGETNDYYLIQIWPDNNQEVVIIK